MKKDIKKHLCVIPRVVRHCVGHLDTLTQKTVNCLTVKLNHYHLKWTGILEAAATCTESIEGIQLFGGKNSH